MGRDNLARKDHGAAINAPAFLRPLSAGLTGVAEGVQVVGLLGEMLEEHHGEWASTVLFRSLIQK